MSPTTWTASLAPTLDLDAAGQQSLSERHHRSGWHDRLGGGPNVVSIVVTAEDGPSTYAHHHPAPHDYRCPSATDRRLHDEITRGTEATVTMSSGASSGPIPAKAAASAHPTDGREDPEIAQNDTPRVPGQCPDLQPACSWRGKYGAHVVRSVDQGRMPGEPNPERSPFITEPARDAAGWTTWLAREPRSPAPLQCVHGAANEPGPLLLIEVALAGCGPVDVAGESRPRSHRSRGRAPGRGS